MKFQLLGGILITATKASVNQLKEWLFSSANWITDIAVAWSAIKWAAVYGTVIRALEPGLIMIQAGMIFGSLMVMAFRLPISGFSAESVIKHMMFILGALMLPLFWHVASMMQEGLLRILYPTAYNVLDLEVSLQTFLFLIFLFFLYFILPAIFMRMMWLSGYEAAQATGEAVSGLQGVGQGTLSSVGSGMKGGYQKTGSFVNKYNPSPKHN